MHTHTGIVIHLGAIWVLIHWVPLGYFALHPATIHFIWKERGFIPPLIRSFVPGVCLLTVTWHSSIALLPACLPICLLALQLLGAICMLMYNMLCAGRERESIERMGMTLTGGISRECKRERESFPCLCMCVCAGIAIACATKCARTVGTLSHPPSHPHSSPYYSTPLLLYSLHVHKGAFDKLTFPSVWLVCVFPSGARASLTDCLCVSLNCHWLYGRIHSVSERVCLQLTHTQQSNTDGRTEY